MDEPAEQRQRIAAYGLARQRGRVLLVRDSRLGRWWLPGGGLHFGESPAEALAREFEEEVALSVVNYRLLDVLSDVGQPSTEPIVWHSVRLIYEVDVPTGVARPEADGSTVAPTWFDFADVESLPLALWLREWLPQHCAR